MAISKIGRNATDTGITDSSNATAITIDSSERIGIGTTSPAQLLHLKADNPGGKIRLEMGQTGVANTDVTGEIQFYHNDASGAGVNADIKGICTNSVGAGALTFGTGTTSTTERMRIDANGNVGIGVAPDDHLHVKGFFQVEGKSGDGNYIRFDNTANSGNIWRIGPGVYSHTTFSIYNQTDNSQVVNIESVNDQLMFRSMTAVTLADDATAIAVANSFQGIVVVTSSSNALTGIYRCEGQNTPTLISGTGSFTNSDTDGKFCLISAGGSSNITFRNRFGATYGFKIASFGVLS
jgi:hypothetical protein